ncbi:MAG: YfhO family protein [Opitutaceae bacterium]|nr:YfhO family protein [Opitutaceae bacterium]MBP9912164.1 YfhO family protein [Opitutaceae bacterium]
MQAVSSDQSNSRLLRGWQKLGPSLVAFFIVGLLLLPDRTFLEGYDWVRMHVFYKEAYRQALVGGVWPHWNPFIALGRPFLADIEVAFFYPPNLLYLFGPVVGLLLTLWLHFSLLLHGMLRLLRAWDCRETAAWFGALGFALGAPLLGRLQSGQIQVFCALCWLPWLFTAGQAVLAQPGRKSAVHLAAVTALFFLAGSPPVFWIAAWALAVWLGSRLLPLRLQRHDLRPGRWLALSGVLAAGLVAVQLLPFLELAGEANRLGRDAHFALQNPFAGQSWWSLLRSKPPGPAFFNWEYNLYCGLPLVLLALVGATQWRRPNVPRLALLAALFGALALGAALPLLPLLVEYVPGWAILRYPSRYAIILIFALCLLAGLGLEQIARWLARPGLRRPVIATSFLLGLLAINALDALHAAWERAGIYASPVNFPLESALTAQLRTTGLLQVDQPPPRVLAPPWLIRENSGLQHGYSTLSGFANPFLSGVWSSLHQQAGLVPALNESVNLPTGIYAMPAGTFPDMAVAAHWDPRQEKFVLPSTIPVRAKLFPAGPGTSVAIQHYSADQLTLGYTAPTPQTLTLAEPWYPGWTATIDGKPLAIHQANGWLRAMAVPPGTHQVHLYFRSRWLTLGAALSLGTLAFCLFWYFGKSKVPAGKNSRPA